MQKLNRRKIAALLLLTLGVLALGEYLLVGALVFVTAVVALAVNLYDLRIFGVELATFSTVLVGYQLGSVPAALAGLFLVVTHMTISQQMGVYAIWVIPSYALLGLAAGQTGMPISQFGVAAIVAMHAVWTVLTAYFTGGIGRYLPYAAGNIVVNAVLFTAAGPFLL